MSNNDKPAAGDKYLLPVERTHTSADGTYSVQVRFDACDGRGVVWVDPAALLPAAVVGDLAEARALLVECAEYVRDEFAAGNETAGRLLGDVRAFLARAGAAEQPDDREPTWAELVADAAGQAAPKCNNCLRCLQDERTPWGQPVTTSRMIVCSTCGNKRCPHATDCRLGCTGSNEPGQPGSSYPAPAEQPAPTVTLTTLDDLAAAELAAIDSLRADAAEQPAPEPLAVGDYAKGYCGCKGYVLRIENGVAIMQISEPCTVARACGDTVSSGFALEKIKRIAPSAPAEPVADAPSIAETPRDVTLGAMEQAEARRQALADSESVADAPGIADMLATDPIEARFAELGERVDALTERVAAIEQTERHCREVVDLYKDQRRAWEDRCVDLTCKLHDAQQQLSALTQPAAPAPVTLTAEGMVRFYDAIALIEGWIAKNQDEPREFLNGMHGACNLLQNTYNVGRGTLPPAPTAQGSAKEAGDD